MITLLAHALNPIAKLLQIINQFFTHPVQGVKNKADQKTGVLGKIGMGAQAGARRAKTTPYAPAGIYSG